MYILYEDTQDNQFGLLDKDLLLSLKAYEDELQSRTVWQNACLAQSNEDSQCQGIDWAQQKWGSFASGLFVFEWMGIDIEEATQMEILGAFQYALDDPTLRLFVEIYFDKSVSDSNLAP